MEVAFSADLDEAYVPVNSEGWRRGHSAVSKQVYELDIGGSWARTRYKGKRMVKIHRHDDWMDMGDDDCECQPETVWVFEVYEGTYHG
jgi:hypothetical protein